MWYISQPTAASTSGKRAYGFPFDRCKPPCRKAQPRRHSCYFVQFYLLSLVHKSNFFSTNEQGHMRCMRPDEDGWHPRTCGLQALIGEEIVHGDVVSPGQKLTRWVRALMTKACRRAQPCDPPTPPTIRVFLLQSQPDVDRKNRGATFPTAREFGTLG